VIDWGYELLELHEKLLLKRLSMFAGPFSARDAETVCSGDGLPASTLLETLTELVAKSFVAPEEGRYRCLDTIRLYGRERLAESGELAGMQVRHAEWLLGLASDRAPGRLAMWLDQLEAVRDELRAALGWAARVEPVLGLRLCAALRQWWQVRGHATEARQFLESLLPAAEDSPAHRACLEVAAGLAYDQGDLAAAHAYLDRAIELARAAGDRTNLVQALDTRSLLLTVGGRLDESEAAAGEALRVAREVGDPSLESHCLYQLGLVLSGRGELDGSVTRFEESLEVLQRTGREDEGLASLVFLGVTLLLQGELQKARRALVTGIKLARLQGDRRVAWALDGMAWLAAAEGRDERAVKVAGAAEAIFKAAGRQPPRGWSVLLESHLQPVRESLGDERSAAEYAAGQRLDFVSALDYALEEEVARQV
jgi:non-specific serine/threonine protein kinase